MKLSEEGKSAPIKLAILVTHPIQYLAPLFRRLAVHPEVDLTVYYCSKQGSIPFYDEGFGRKIVWDQPLTEGYKCSFLRNWGAGPQSGSFFSFVNPGIVWELQKANYDVIMVYGYEHFTKWLAFIGSRLSNTHVLIRGDSNLLSPRPLYKRIVKKLVIGKLLRSLEGCVSVGQCNRSYYEHFRVEESRIFFAPHCVDNDYWRRSRNDLKKQRPQIKKRIGIPAEVPVILMAAKLVPWKQPMLLLKAFSNIRKDLHCALVFLGEGSLRVDLEDYCLKHSVEDVFITGFVNQKEMPQFYSIGDIFVLPSKFESYGLVVNEAMNFEMPIVVSDRVGCSADLVYNGRNGFVFRYDDEKALEEKLKTLIANPEMRQAFGEESGRIISSWGIEECVAGIVEACRFVL